MVLSPLVISVLCTTLAVLACIVTRLGRQLHARRRWQRYARRAHPLRSVGGAVVVHATSPPGGMDGISALIARLDARGGQQGPTRVRVVAGAGAGKSTLLAVLAARLAAGNACLPVLVEALEVLDVHPFERAEQMLADARGHRAAARFAGTLHGAAARGRVVLLMDGVEKLTGRERSILGTRVESWARHHERMPMVIATRPGGLALVSWSRIELDGLDARARSAALAPRDLDRVERICAAWPRAAGWLRQPLMFEALSDALVEVEVPMRGDVCRDVLQRLFARARLSGSAERAALERLGGALCSAWLFGGVDTPRAVVGELVAAASREPGLRTDLDRLGGAEEALALLRDRVGLFVAQPDERLAMLDFDPAACLAAQDLDGRPSRVERLLLELPTDPSDRACLALALWCSMGDCQAERWARLREVRPVLAGRARGFAEPLS